MKPFNLERALAGDPVIYRNGSKVYKIMDTEIRGRDSQPIISIDADKFYYNFHELDGAYVDSRRENEFDLMMATVVKIFIPMAVLPIQETYLLLKKSQS